MKKSVAMALAPVVALSLMLTGCSGGGSGKSSSEEPASETSDKASNNDDLLADGIGKDYGLGPVGFDLDTLVERMGEEVSNLTIGVSSTSLTSPWVIDWCDELSKLGNEYGFEVVMLNGSNNNDPTQQASDLKSMQTQQVDGVIVFCEFPDAVTPVLNELHNLSLIHISEPTRH